MRRVKRFTVFFLLFLTAAFGAEAEDLEDLIKQVKRLESEAKGIGALAAVSDFPEFLGWDALLRSFLNRGEEAAKGKETPEERRAKLKAIMVEQDTLLLAKEKEIGKLAEERLKNYTENYARDHAPLMVGKVWNDLTKKLEDLYALLAAADALSFMAENSGAREKFQKLYPGYDGRRGVLDFAEVYRDLMKGWQDYSFGTLMANNKEALDIKDNLLKLMTGALSGLDFATTSSLGYIQVLQARSQVKIFVAQEVVNLRVDILREMDARVRYAAERQQKKTDRQVAFGKAVNIWQKQGSRSTGY